MLQQTNNMHLLVSFILVVNLVKNTAANPVKITVRLEEAKDADSTEEEGEDCLACAQLKEALQQTPSPEEIRQARIEHVKQMILQKLRMTSPPNVTRPLRRLPEPLLRKHGGLYGNDDGSKADSTEPYYAETKEVISFAESAVYCDHSNTTVCFSIHLKHSIDVIKSAKLYVKNTFPGRTLTIYDATQDKSDPVLIHTKSSHSKSWIHFNLHDTVANLVENSVTVKLSLKLAWQGSGRNVLLKAIEENLPFIEMHTDEGPERNRRRVTQCLGEDRCCKHEFYVSFADIGWADWIHSPEGYPANYCSGTCTDLHELPAYQHSRVMFALPASGPTAPARSSLCCSPTKLSRLSLLYQDEDGEILKKDLPNMSVESCGCA